MSSRGIEKGSLPRSENAYSRHVEERQTTETVIHLVEEGLKRLVPAYLERRRCDVASLETALNNSDWQTITMIGHRMIGNSAMLGFPVLEKIGCRLEAGGNSRNFLEIAELIAAMRRALFDDRDSSCAKRSTSKGGHENETR